MLQHSALHCRIVSRLYNGVTMLAENVTVRPFFSTQSNLPIAKSSHFSVIPVVVPQAQELAVKFNYQQLGFLTT